MVEKKLTVMVIEVDLCCEKCRRKIKKVLCDIPQIQNQVYDEKTNTVIITVYCCCPEKIMKKICCKGGKTVKVIKIKPPEKPPPAPSPTKSPQAQTAPSSPPQEVQPRTCCRECYEGYGGGPCYQGYGRPVPCYEGYRRPVYDCWGGGYGRVCYVGRCDYYLCEENPRGCIIM